MKRISPSAYAEAFVAVALMSEEKAARGLVSAIRRHNDWARRGKILEACEQAWRKIEGKSLLTIESARPLAREQVAKLAHRFPRSAYDVEEKVNPSLVAGAKLIIDGERQFDGSLKRKIDKLFSLN